MTFSEYSDCFVWVCNDCGLEAVFPPDDFWHRKNELSARGWRFTRHERDGWLHQCGACARKEATAAVSVLDKVPWRPKS
jgi:hypothetical protein